MHYVSIHCDFVPDLSSSSCLSCSLFCCILSHFPLSLFPLLVFFACRAKTQLLPKDSLICVPIVAQCIARSPDKEMRRKACVSESRLHHHWNARPLNYLSHLATSVCMHVDMCMWVYQSIFFLFCYIKILTKSVSLCEKFCANTCTSVRMKTSIRLREREREMDECTGEDRICYWPSFLWWIFKAIQFLQ